MKITQIILKLTIIKIDMSLKHLSDNWNYILDNSLTVFFFTQPNNSRSFHQTHQLQAT